MVKRSAFHGRLYNVIFYTLYTKINCCSFMIEKRCLSEKVVPSSLLLFFHEQTVPKYRPKKAEKWSKQQHSEMVMSRAPVWTAVG